MIIILCEMVIFCFFLRRRFHIHPMFGSSIVVHKCQTIDYDDVHGRDDEDDNDKNDDSDDCKILTIIMMMVMIMMMMMVQKCGSIVVSAHLIMMIFFMIMMIVVIMMMLTMVQKCGSIVVSAASRTLGRTAMLH